MQASQSGFDVAAQFQRFSHQRLILFIGILDGGQALLQKIAPNSDSFKFNN